MSGGRTRAASDGEVEGTSEEVVQAEAEGHQVAVGNERRGPRVGLDPVPDTSHDDSFKSAVTDFYSSLSGTSGRARTDLPSERENYILIYIFSFALKDRRA